MVDLQALLAKIEALPPEQQAAIVKRINEAYEDSLPSGTIIATGVSLDDYMEHYAAQHCEWVEGYVIQIAPAELRHNTLIKYLAQLFDVYFELRPIGRVIIQPFVMRLPAYPNRRREPDLLVVLNTNPHELTKTYMDGPADICIEIVSEESTERDRGEKFQEYEKGGVPEYWVVDHLRHETQFYWLDEAGRYIRQDMLGDYRTPVLPGLALHVPTLWQDNLPGPGATVNAVKAMLEAQG